MDILQFGNISNNIPLWENFKYLFITDSDKFKDSLRFDQLLRANQVDKALSLYHVKNRLIDLVYSVTLVSRFCDLKNFKKYEAFCHKKILLRRKEFFYHNALNWSIASDNYEQVSYLYHRHELKAEWFNEELFKIAIENNASNMIEFFIHEVRIPFTTDVKSYLESKESSLLTVFQNRVPFLYNDQSEFKHFIEKFNQQKLFPLKNKSKLKIHL